MIERPLSAVPTMQVAADEHSIPVGSGSGKRRYTYSVAVARDLFVSEATFLASQLRVGGTVARSE
jgi:hypothetical protein